MVIFFWVFGGLSILGSLGVLLTKKPINGILWMALTFLSIGAIYILSRASFLGIIQILVYAGAVIILFLFFLMLTRIDLPKEDLDLSPRGFLITLLIFALFGGLFLGIHSLLGKKAGEFLKGGPSGIADLLLSRYLLPFEVISILLLVALMTGFLFSRRRVP